MSVEHRLTGYSRTSDAMVEQYPIPRRLLGSREKCSSRAKGRSRSYLVLSIEAPNKRSV